MSRTKCKWRTAAFTSLAVLATVVMAQPGPPMEGPRPQGFDPAPPSAAQPAMPPAGDSPRSAPQPEPEWLVTRNTADLSAWVTVYKGRDVVKAGCIAAKQQLRWALDDPHVTIKGELVRDPACKPPAQIACAAVFDRRPGMAVLDLRGGQGCGWTAAAVPPGGLKGDVIPACCWVRNSTKHSMWVTMYEGVPRSIARTACVQPGRTDFVHAASTAAWIRAEITGRANCQPARAKCDTTMTISSSWFDVKSRPSAAVLLPASWDYQAGGGCWWQTEPRR